MNRNRREGKKSLIKEIERLKKTNQAILDTVREECVSRDELLRIYAIMRCAVRDTLGEKAWEKVKKNLQDMGANESRAYANEANQVFGDQLKHAAPAEIVRKQAPAK